MKRFAKPGMLAAGLTALALTVPMANADMLEANTTVISSCGKLFSIDSNAAGMTAAERASIVQKNLDNALIAAKHRTPDAVQVSMMNNNPIVTVDNFYIVTADGNSAARANMTQKELAHKWADSIRFCLADATALNNYIAMLTGKYETKTVVSRAAMVNADIAVMPSGKELPVQLSNDLSADAAQIGDKVNAVLSTDVPLGPNFTSYIPAGTEALGEVIGARSYMPNNFAGKHAKTINFYALRMPDGEEIPINGHFFGGVNSWRYVSVNPMIPNAAGMHGQKLEVRDGVGNRTIVSLKGTRGVIGGAWRGEAVDMATQSNFHRLMLSQGSGLVIPAGEKMMLQLNSTTTMAINTPANAETTAKISSAGYGL